MNKEISSISSALDSLINETQRLNIYINSLNHPDPSTNNHLNNIKKMTLQSLDIFNALQRQLGFFSNSCKSFSHRESLRLQREEKENLRKNRKNRRFV